MMGSNWSVAGPATFEIIATLPTARYGGGECRLYGEQFAKRHDGSRCLAELRPLMTFNCEGRLRRTLSGTKVLIGLPEIS